MSSELLMTQFVTKKNKTFTNLAAYGPIIVTGIDAVDLIIGDVVVSSYPFCFGFRAASALHRIPRSSLTSRV